MGWLVLLVMLGIIISVITFGLRRFQPDFEHGRETPRPLPQRQPVLPAPQPVILNHNNVPKYGFIGGTGTLGFDPRSRMHTAVAGSTGDGKTTTMNTLLVQDLLADVQAVVCSTHFTYYHPEDQRIDLRPLAHLFEVAYTPEAIRAVMQAACNLVDERMPIYRAGGDVGHDVCLYFGEWDTSIQRHLGQDATEMLQHILDEGRKTRVWVSFIEVHGAQVNRFGGDSALRAAFKTRFAGNVDATSWRAFIGKQYPQQPVPRGYWMTDKGLVEVRLPQPHAIAYMARTLQPHGYTPLGVVIEDADRLLEQVFPAENEAENLPSVERDFSALESGFTISSVTFSVEEIAQIAAMIAAGNGKTETIKSMPRYTGRKHKEYAAWYERLKVAVDSVPLAA